MQCWCVINGGIIQCRLKHCSAMTKISSKESVECARWDWKNSKMVDFKTVQYIIEHVNRSRF